jgi:hypothetical protein
MAAKGRIVNTTPKGKHSLERTRFTVLHSGSTFNARRNNEKREARLAEQDLRHDQVAAFHAGLIAYAPKRRMSGAMTDLLANRRLRQRGRA